MCVCVLGTLERGGALLKAVTWEDQSVYMLIKCGSGKISKLKGTKQFIKFLAIEGKSVSKRKYPKKNHYLLSWVLCARQYANPSMLIITISHSQ